MKGDVVSFSALPFLRTRRADTMRKGRDRAQRRGRFDDDDAYGGPDQELPRQSFQQAPRASATPSGPAIDATVKWFNPEKGFGFVELGNGSGDAFLHVAVLEGAGHETVLPGSKLRVQVGQGQKGPQVTAVLAVDVSTAAPAPIRKPSIGAPSSQGRANLATASDIEGTVKWFSADKGFGFVVCEDGGKDVFLHISVVERAGLRGVDEGQRLAMKVVNTLKGREAISFTLID
jgi:cold shock protein